jgi:PASTA domain
MTVEEQLREYRESLDAATEAAAASHLPRSVVPIRIRPARTLLVAAVAVAAAVAIGFAAVGVSHRSSTRPAGTGTSAASPITDVAGNIVVPNVIGMKAATATTTLGSLGFSIMQRDVSCRGPLGVVTGQDPRPGTHVIKASTITQDVCTRLTASPTTTLPVVVCTTVYGVPPSATDPKAPKSLTVATPPFAAPKLSGYSDLRGFLPITAPAGWNCKALEATDGGQAVGVTPPGVTPRDSWGTGGTVTQPPTDGVFALSDPACQGCVWDDACAIVPGIKADFAADRAQGPCPAAPAGQRVTAMGNHVYSIDDPAGTLGPDEAHSILRYTPKTLTTDPMVIRETCILPAAQLAVCNALLDEFVALQP